MEGKIEIGDVVTVYFCDTTQLTDVKVTWVPQDTGDMWYFDHNGDIHAVNPNSANLVEIVKKSDVAV